MFERFDRLEVAKLVETMLVPFVLGAFLTLVLVLLV
jgi:hypothetical protein